MTKSTINDRFYFKASHAQELMEDKAMQPIQVEIVKILQLTGQQFRDFFANLLQDVPFLILNKNLTDYDKGVTRCLLVTRRDVCRLRAEDRRRCRRKEPEIQGRILCQCELREGLVGHAVAIAGKRMPLNEVIFYNSQMEFQVIYDIQNRIKPVLEHWGIRFTEVKLGVPFLYNMLESPVKEWLTPGL